MDTIKLTLEDLSGAEAALLQQALTALDGVTGVDIALPAGTATVSYDGARCGADQIEAALARAGFGVHTPSSGGCGGGGDGCCGGCGGHKHGA